MRAAALALAWSLCVLTPGCMYLTPRPPIIEKKLGMPDDESIGALSTAADYRVVVVKIKAHAEFCAEPSPDAASQYAAQVAAALSGPLKDATLSAQAQVNMALSMKQLFQRSQGVQLYRDGLFALCNSYLNKAIGGPAYLEEVRALRQAARDVIMEEVPHMHKRQFDTTPAPTSPPIDLQERPPSANPGAAVAK